VVWHEHGYDGRACACGLVFLDPPPAAEDVDLTKEVHSDEFYRYPAETRVSFVQRVRPTGRLLEVGCGGGAFLEAARRRGYDVVGMEPDEARAARAEAEVGVPVVRNFVEDAAAPDEGFDVVFHVDLMSHFPDPELALRAMAHQLRPGGVLCFEAGVLGGIAPAWYRWLGSVGFPEHRWLYSRAAMVAMLERSDLEIVRVERFGLLASHLFTPLRRLAARLMRRAQLDPKAETTGTSGLRRWSDRIEFVLSYRVGRFLPEVGPQALMIAARPSQARGGT
jgi:SAM-dependent methyltransferase